MEPMDRYTLQSLAGIELQKKFRDSVTRLTNIIYNSVIDAAKNGGTRYDYPIHALNDIAENALTKLQHLFHDSEVNLRFHKNGSDILYFITIIWDKQQ